MYFVEVPFTARYMYLFHIRGRVREQQASPKQTNPARIIEIFGKVARCWIPTSEVTSFIRPINTTCVCNGNALYQAVELAMHF